ncbi:MAG: hypothetical protein KKA07_15850 [Bacteroidetes bacterium]|nr:hypothetical protein [Bacteroidota bacterium]MBU1720537.1 hypothetical protein [Bacteroidota bacterium]
MKKIVFSLFLSGLMVSSCTDHDDFFTITLSENVVKKIFLKGDGLWNIDEMKFSVVDLDGNTIMFDTSFVAPGSIQFSSAEKMNINYNNDGIDGKFFTLRSDNDCDWEYLGGDIEFNYGVGIVSSLNKDNMLILVPANMSKIETNRLILYRNVECQIKLSKK